MATFIPHDNQSSIPADKDSVVPFDAFYPALSLSHFRKVMRVDDTVSHDRIIEQMQSAILTIAYDIARWRSKQTVNQLSDLDDAKTTAYRMAVYNRTKALIIENYRDIDTTNDGHAKAESMESRIDSYLQRSREMQRMLTATPRSTIKLV